MAPKSNWSPKSKAEQSMDKKFRSWTRAERMAEAVRLVMDERWSQSRAAKHCGVSRPRVNENVKAAREERAVVEARIERSRAANVAESDLLSSDHDRSESTDSSAPTDPSEQERNDRSVSETPPWVADGRDFPTFPEFNGWYFSNEICPDCDTHHDTPDFHVEVMELLQDRSKRHKLINLAPYHAKSTTCTVKWVLYEICRDPSVRIALISRAGDLAEAFLYQIKQHLQDPDLYIGAHGNLIEDWGPFYNPGYWARDQIYIHGRSGAQKDPTVSCYGFGKQIYGRRFDIMIFDDVADLENQHTPESISKMYKKIWQEYSNRVGQQTGQIAWVGTRVAPADIYSLLDDVDGIATLRYPCILDEERQLTLWPEHFPYGAAVKQRNAMTESDFQLVYQNVDTPGIGASFTQEALDRSHDNDRFIGQYDPSWGLVAGLDPAGSGDQSGYTAMILLGVDLMTGRRHLVDLVNVKAMKSPDVIRQIEDWADRYPLRELRVEVNGLQGQLYQYNEQLRASLSNRGVRIAPHITHKGNKWDPQFGVESMAPLYYNGTVTTPWADANSRAKFRELEQQLIQFPMGSVTDLVMAFWFAELAAREFHQRSKLPLYDTRTKVPGRIRRKRGVIDFGEGVRAPTVDEENGAIFGVQHVQEPPARFVNVPTPTGA